MTTHSPDQEVLKASVTDLERELRNLESLQINGYRGDRGPEGFYMTKCNMLASALMFQTQIVEVLLKKLNLSADPLWVSRIKRIRFIYNMTVFGGPGLKRTP